VYHIYPSDAGRSFYISEDISPLRFIVLLVKSTILNIPPFPAEPSEPKMFAPTMVSSVKLLLKEKAPVLWFASEGDE